MRSEKQKYLENQIYNKDHHNSNGMILAFYFDDVIMKNPEKYLIKLFNWFNLKTEYFIRIRLQKNSF